MISIDLLSWQTNLSTTWIDYTKDCESSHIDCWTRGVFGTVQG